MSLKRDTAFRPLTDRERRILDRLLGLDFIGREQLSQQLPELLARRVEDTGTLEFKASKGPAAPRDGCVAEAHFKDRPTDAADVMILLHVKDGKLSLLEIYKEDGSPIQNEPDPDRLTNLFTSHPKK